MLRNVFPTERNVACRQRQKAVLTEGGIEIPEMYQEQSPFYEVMAIGPLVKVLKVGDLVTITAGSRGTVVTVSGEEADNLVVCHEAVVVARIVEVTGEVKVVEVETR